MTDTHIGTGTVAPAGTVRARDLVLDLAAAAILAAAVSVIGWFAIQSVEWPAYNSSNVTRSLATVAQVAAVVILTGSAWVLSLGRSARPLRMLSFATISGFVTATLALPLGGTTLYLGGISVDQQFRTEFLTRFTSSPRLADMTYVDMPPLYSPGWFWLGGRFARIFGFDGWEAFQPWSVLSLSVAAALAAALWFAIVSPAKAVAATLATTIAMLLYGSAEPYGAVVTILLPPVLIFAWRAVTRGDRLALAITAIYLGGALWFYTLYLGVAAFVVVLMGVLALVASWVRERRIDWQIPGRVAVIGVITIALGLPAYGPFLLRMAKEPSESRGSAFHYLPEQGAVLPMPMLHFSLLGALALIGVVWVLVRFRSTPEAQALGIGIVGVYLWALLSMVATVAQTTLLGFRTEPVLHVLLAAAGALGAVAIAGSLGDGYPRYRQAGVILAGVAAIGVAQTIPAQLAGEIAVAYSDTDGNGNRGDRRPAGAESSYRDVDAAILAATGRPRTDTVVLTADYGFLAIYPYWGFQNLTSNYANPLAQFTARSEAIEAWSKMTSTDEFLGALGTAPWRPPNAFVFRKSSDGLALRLAEDVYPNDPNVRRYTVTFPEKLFADPRFSSTEVGPFVVIVRK
ncbi:Galactan 5-O-arabinofuranosyltransferase OS=Tsukamurella paurometabola (strain ATCC 8368 / DSM/ CCUG 35730 / CIP 100753 / JCM 10117 / KCTC 9821 / NBRC 16120 / NCIMB 702349 / NCTC 13040) OX=521096 GN=Tpau_4121 PE=3 SV=1 [Tsukamurella paurometabola]|uniref:Galactan 5-O-arabinofuranosyltransferase n=1 Tax=Tsukamurella paurometabola (strain ATCC 8368 / DSM 20162 / CCUG 35730 / CIP 100753 / JCM 10117 / KCTC 9821 / NBRC 16120 / NCIMB 702349 / NCTC 13040) TaxID=521096 RepID=D5UNY1_TSUPD|nr:galactan 5-O-arabinofuranosyltransferase [Tsukamurella paurometabola]ADG80690.1 arabinosyltransferase AftA [Tsukamurella paurometabola DSM 20162]SUP40585.1 Arabinofuranosyltransferase AftA [Tsukamurella paurometabola]